MKTSYTLHKLPEGFIVTSNEDIKQDDYYIAWETNYATEPKERWVLYNLISELNGINQKKVIALQDQIDFSDLSEEECKLIKLDNDYWVKGNRVRVTTIHDYESKIFLSKGRWVNKGKQIYEGFVIEVDKGLALKTDDGKIFKTQSTYWFGSILEQKIEVIEKTQEILSDKQFTYEDMLNYTKWLQENASRNNNSKWVFFDNQFYDKTNEEILDKYLSNLKHSWNVEVQIEENKVKVLKIL